MDHGLLYIVDGPRSMVYGRPQATWSAVSGQPSVVSRHFGYDA